MKLNHEAFPYPVLNSEAGAGADYDDCSFQCNLVFDQKVGDDQAFKVEYEFLLSNEEIETLIEKGSAEYSLHLYCSDTLKREMFPLSKSGVIELDASELYGKVEFTPLVVVKKPVSAFTSVDLNIEFGDTTFDLSIGDIIAVDDTWVKYIEFNNQSFDSLVKTVVDRELDDPYSYTIEPTPHFIYIRLGTEMHKLYKEMQNKKHKGILGMSLFKDVLFMAIEDLITNHDEAETQQWARSFRNKIESAGFKIPRDRDFNEINLLAQKFVKEIGVAKLFKEFNISGK